MILTGETEVQKDKPISVPRCVPQIPYGHAWYRTRGEFRSRQTRQLPRAVDLKGRLLSCQSY